MTSPQESTRSVSASAGTKAEPESVTGSHNRIGDLIMQSQPLDLMSGGFFCSQTGRAMSPRHIIVVTGSDPELEVDLTAFRAVRRAGIPFTRLKNPTFNEFTAHLRRMRMQRGAVGDVHLAMHMSPAGAEFVDQVVSPELLSEVLDGVNILFLAGCESTAIGDLLGLVPAVVTLLEKIDHGSARDFGQLFWLAVAEGNDAQAAFDLSLERLPDVGEYAYLHVHTAFLARGTG